MMTQTKTQPNINTPKQTNGNSAHISTQTNTAPANTVTANSAQNSANALALTMTEAPYSWNVTVIDDLGFVEQFTVRAINERPFFDRVGRAKKELAARGYKPALRGGTPKSVAQHADENDAAPLCAIHKTPMVKRQGKNGSFWSCPKRLDDGSYCPYRPAK